MKTAATQEGRFLLEQMEQGDEAMLDYLLSEKIIKPKDCRYVRKTLAKGEEEVLVLRRDESSPPRAIIVGHIEDNEVTLSFIEVHRDLPKTLEDILSLDGTNAR